MFKRHYNIIVVGCCLLFAFVNVGLASTAFSVHQPYIVDMDGIGDGSGSIILSTNKLTAFAAMFFVDRYYSLLGDRRGVFLATICTTCGFVVYSLASSLPGFMVGSVLTGLGYGCGGMVAVTYIVNRWFATNIGSVIGIAAMGSGFCAIFMPYVVTGIIHAFSLQTAFLVEAAIALAVGLLVFALLRNGPASLGISQFGANKQGESAKRRSIGMAGLRPSSKFARGLLFVSIVGVGIFACGGSAYVSVLATSSGFSPVVAASYVSAIGIAMTIAKFCFGEIFDRIGVFVGSVIIFSCGICGYALCCMAPLGNPYVVLVGVLLMGVGMVAGSLGISVWSIDLSTPETRARQIRSFQMLYQLGGFIANFAPGFVKDLTGSYVFAYAGFGLIALITAIVILGYYRKYRMTKKG